MMLYPPLMCQIRTDATDKYTYNFFKSQMNFTLFLVVLYTIIPEQHFYKI